jgi:hypothetical protein
VLWKPATLQGQRAFVGSSVVSGDDGKAAESRDLVLLGGRLDSALVATSDGRRRADDRLGISGGVTASRRLVLSVGTSVGLDGRVLDVVAVRQGGKRSAAGHVAESRLRPALILDRHTVTEVLADEVDDSYWQTDLVVMYVSNSLLEAYEPRLEE